VAPPALSMGAIGPRCGEERPDAVDLHIAPDETAALAAIAFRFVVLRDVDLGHGCYAIFTGATRDGGLQSLGTLHSEPLAWDGQDGAG
jgi:hypothetical protein